MLNEISNPSTPSALARSSAASASSARSHADQQRAKIVMRGCVVQADRESAPVSGLGLCEPGLFAQRHRQAWSRL